MDGGGGEGRAGGLNGSAIGASRFFITGCDGGAADAAAEDAPLGAAAFGGVFASGLGVLFEAGLTGAGGAELEREADALSGRFLGALGGARVIPQRAATSFA